MPRRTYVAYRRCLRKGQREPEMPYTSDAALRRRCRALLARISLPQPFSVEALCTHLGEQRGRPIHLHPLPEQAAMAGACGLWLATATDDHIFHECHTVRPHQEHIVLHEIGHMLFDHHSLAPAGGHTGALLADLDPRLIRRLLARTNYSTRQEQEAEMLASLMRTSERACAEERPPGALGRLQAALGVVGSHDR